MSFVRRLYSDLTDEQYRTAVTIGVAAMPFVALENALYGPVDHTESALGTVLFLACLVSGYLYSRRAGEASRAGTVTGIAGGSAVMLWLGWLTLTDWWHHSVLLDLVGDSWGMVAAVVAGTLATVGISAGVTAVIGWVAGTIGGRLHDFVGKPELSVT
jgi:hypothetical protein